VIKVQTITVTIAPQNFFPWFDSHSASVVVVATIIYVVFTYRLVVEERQSRQQENAPAVSAFFELSVVSSQLLMIVIRNDGRTLARNIVFSNDANTIESANRHARIPPLLSGTLPHLGPGRQIESYFGSFPELLANGGLPDFTVKVTWDDSTGKRQETQNFPLSVRPYEGTFSVGDRPPEYRSADSLKEIARLFSSIVSGSSRVKANVMTQGEMDRQEENFLRQWRDDQAEAQEPTDPVI
jgi:hypothetical protein